MNFNHSKPKYKTFKPQTNILCDFLYIFKVKELCFSLNLHLNKLFYFWLKIVYTHKDSTSDAYMYTKVDPLIVAAMLRLQSPVAKAFLFLNNLIAAGKCLWKSIYIL